MPKSSRLLAWPTRRWLELYGRSVPLSNRSSRIRDPKFEGLIPNYFSIFAASGRLASAEASLMRRLIPAADPNLPVLDLLQNQSPIETKGLHPSRRL